MTERGRTMGDERLAEIREALAGENFLADPAPLTVRSCRALLAEVDRLRAELAGRRADEKWLEVMREETAGYRMAEDFHALTVRHARQLFAHIDWQNEQIRILLTDEDGPALAREQGAAEERGRIEEVVTCLWESALRYREAGIREGDIFKSVLSTIGREALPELLPPAESRRLLAEAGRKVAALREALETIEGNEWCPLSILDVIRAVLEATR